MGQITRSQYVGALGLYQKMIKFTPVYGPVNSRRLGHSLGINPVKGGFLCNLACNYCEYSDESKTANKKKISFYELSEIEDALDKRLKTNVEIDSLTLSGPTEPTLHPHFDELANLVAQKRDQYCPDAKMSLFTNGYRVSTLELSYFDNVFLKLDVGSEEAFKRFNEAKDITFNRVINQIKQANVDQKIIQSMIVAGVDGNYNSKDIEDYLKVLKEIEPDTVGLYSILYQWESSVDLTPVSKEELSDFAKRIRKEVGCEAEVYVDPVELGEMFSY